MRPEDPAFRLGVEVSRPRPSCSSGTVGASASHARLSPQYADGAIVTGPSCLVSAREGTRGGASLARLTPHRTPARTWDSPGLRSPRLCPRVRGTGQGLETRPEAGPAQGVWGPRSLPASPRGPWPAPSQRRHLQPRSCVAVSPGRECRQGSTPRSGPGSGRAASEGEMKACLALALHARPPPPHSRAWSHLARPSAVLVEGPLCPCSSGQGWAAMWPPPRPSLLASACQREGNLIFKRLIALE